MKKLLLLIGLLSTHVFASAQGVPSYVPSSGLLAWYSFSGNANDNSGSGYNGTVTDAILTTDRFGNANSAYLFNGSSSVIATNLLPPTGNGARTITCWFQYDSLPNPCGDAGLCIVGYGADTRECIEACKNFSLEMVYGAPRASIDGVCIATREFNPADTFDNGWHFFAAVYDPSYGDFSAIKVYIDGVFKTTTTSVYGGSTTVMTDTFSKLDIGAGHYPDCRRFFDGKIDDIGVWNRALTEDELFNLYNVTPTAIADSFIVYDGNNCSGIQYTVITNSFSADKHIKTYFGNGDILDTVVTAFGTKGIAGFSKYNINSGTYTTKHILYNGTVAIDSITYSHEYKLCNTLSIQYYNDLNGNCNYDSSTDVIISMPILTEVDSNGISVDTIASASGFYYTAYGAPGDIYSFKPISYPAAIVCSCPASGIITDTLQSSTFVTTRKYIGMACSMAPSYDLALYAVVNATGTNDQSGDIYVQNSASCVLVDATVTLHFGTEFIPLDIADGSIYNMIPAASATTSTSVSWNLSSFNTPGSTPKNLWYAIYHNPSVGYFTIGDSLQTTYTVSPTTGDIDTTNNSVTLTEIVKGGCDPNEMWVSPDGCISTTTGATKLRYTIMFENTGNDTAHNIYVMDTLSNELDLSTMRLVMTSAQMNVSKLKTPAGQNILKFDFPEINLLDSSYHGKCYGTVIFSIDTKSALPDGTTINNEAGIYFDYNTVVMTNVVQNIIGCPTTTAVEVVSSNEKIDIYPNPSQQELTVTSTTPINNITITNTMGQQISQQPYNSDKVRLDISHFPSGIYFIKINGSTVRKFIKS